MKCYARDGSEITVERWVILFENLDYRVLEQDEVGGYLVSTVWLGLDHSFGQSEFPWIFETMVFAPDPYERFDYSGVEQHRYSTEEDARAGHKRLLEQVALITEATQ